MKRRGRPRHPDVLTPREWEVLAFLREGLSNEQIADRLQISLAGAKYHVSEILSKLGLESRQEAAAWVRPERPWWTAAGAPIALLWRRTSSSLVAGAAAGGVIAAVVAGLGIIVWALLRTNGGEPTNTLPLEGIRHVTFAQGQVVSADGPGLFFVDPESGATEGWVVPGGGVFEFMLTGISADGSLVLYSCREQRPEGSPVPCDDAPEPGVWHLLDTEQARRTTLPGGVQYLSLSPNGETLLGISDGEFVLAAVRDPEDRRGIGLAGDAPRFATSGGSTWAPDGSAVLVTSERATHLVRASDGVHTELLPASQSATLPGIGWSTDGSKIALARHPSPDPTSPSTAGTPGILVFDASGTLLWESLLPGGNPRWSPDGSQLAVTVDPPRVPTPSFALDFRLDVFAGETGAALYRIDGVICPGDVWAADGANLLVESYDGQGTFLADPETGTFRPLGTFAVPHPSRSAGVRFDGRGFQLVDLSSGAITPLAETTVDPAWYSDHGPRFVDDRLVFSAPHLGHGGCGVGTAPEELPQLAFQYPPFVD